jgi:hypothetical protein
MEIKRMEFRNLLNVQNRDELRQWLLENYNKEPECWVVVKRGRPVDDETFWYIDAVEEGDCLQNDSFRFTEMSYMNKFIGEF